MNVEHPLVGGSGSPDRPLPTIRLSGGGDVSISNGHSGAVRFTVTRPHNSSLISFFADNLPAGVSAEFSPKTIPDGPAGSSVVTLTLVAATSAPTSERAVDIVASSDNALPGSLVVHLTVASPFSQIDGAILLPIGISGQSVVTGPPVVLAISGHVETAVNLELAANVSGTLSLAVGGILPSGVSANIQPQALSAPGLAGPMAVQISFSAAATALASSATVRIFVSVDGQLRGTLILPVQIVLLASNNNYFLSSSCNPLLGLSVTISISEDLVAAPPAANQQHGFAFQLNASSPPNAANPSDPNWIVWQQYIIGVGSGKIRGAVNNWTAASLSGTQTINPVIVLDTLPCPDMIPAGYALTITLTNDVLGNVNGVRFTINPGGSQEIALNSVVKKDGQRVTTADLAPIVAFEVNLVGPGDSKVANFISGAGAITYTASTPLQALGGLPTCVASTVTTAETANSVYGMLPSASGRTFTQLFSVKITTVHVPHIIGLSPIDVLTALSAAGLTPVTETSTLPSPNDKSPICVSQQPAAGTPVRQGSAVIYRIHQFIQGPFPPNK